MTIVAASGLPQGRTTAPAAQGRAAQPSARGRAAAVFAASLTFDRVECRFEGKSALLGLSLTVDPGEIVCLLGPSGSGKTTLLRIASGIEQPTAGRVLIDGSEVAGPNGFVPPEHRGVGLMFQDFALFPHLSIADNIAFGLKRLSRAEARQQVMAVLDRVGLSAVADAFPATLSGGEQQRVALARAILPRPRVMLMDEPFSGLDVQLRDHLQVETLKLLAETRATCLMVTHSPEEAMRIADRIAVMRDGRLVQTGSAEQLYRDPADLFVARLFSEINEIPLVVTGGALRSPAGTFAAPELAEGEVGILCIRRSAIRIATTGDGLPGRVLKRRFLGDTMLVEIGIAGFEQPLSMIVREDQAPPPTGDVMIAIDPAGVLVFGAGN